MDERMIVLVVNLGSTSFKCKLFRFASGEDASPRVLATGAADRISLGASNWSVQAGDAAEEGTADLTDHAAAIEKLLSVMLRLGAIERLGQVEAIGFKAVHGGPIRSAVRVDEDVLATMEAFSDVAPAHNPPYIAAMRAFAERLPDVPQVAAFETAFHQTIPLARQVYGVDHEWIEKLGIRRYGFHGASHRYIATRLAEIAPEARRVVSLHLGGSCSVCAIREGVSVANSFGMTAQSGVFHNNRVGDFDVFALLKLLKRGMTIEAIFERLGQGAGLRGLSGVSADLREVEAAAVKGDPRARLAVQAFVESCRHYLGAYLAILNGADAIVFTAGIGQHSPSIRAAVCQDLDYAGIHLDAVKNDQVTGDAESRIDAGGSATRIWVLPANEELIVARQTMEVLSGSGNARITGTHMHEV